MKIYLIMFFAVFAFVQTQAQCGKKNTEKPKEEKTMANEDVKFKDLPDGVKLDDEVRVDEFNDKGEVVSYKVITVEKKLREIGAKYVDNKLVDKDGMEIRFYKPPVRGASQGFEEDEKQRKRDEKEFAELKEKFTVIEIYVNRLKAL